MRFYQKCGKICLAGVYFRYFLADPFRPREGSSGAGDELISLRIMKINSEDYYRSAYVKVGEISEQIAQNRGFPQGAEIPPDIRDTQSACKLDRFLSDGVCLFSPDRAGGVLQHGSRNVAHCPSVTHIRMVWIAVRSALMAMSIPSRYNACGPERSSNSGGASFKRAPFWATICWSGRISAPEAPKAHFTGRRIRINSWRMARQY